MLMATTAVCFASAPICGAQRPASSTAQRGIGCWKLEPGRFKVVGRTHVDPGQTTLPALIQLDTVPGKNWTGEPIGCLVRTLSPEKGYQDGYYVLAGADRLQIDWTSKSGFVGMTLMLRVGKDVMRGRASAWTDYAGEERAPIVLRRVACP